MDSKKFDARVKTILSQLSVPESKELSVYLEIKGKTGKLKFIEEHPDIPWNEMKANKDGTYGATAVNAYLDVQKMKCDDESENGRIIAIKRKMLDKTAVSRKVKLKIIELEDKAVARMTKLTDKEIDDFLIEKWIVPIISRIETDMNEAIMKLVNGLIDLRDEYGFSMPDIDKEIMDMERSLNEMLEHLTGCDEDAVAIDMFR